MLPRAATTTIRLVDEYCVQYKDLFGEVRTFENFKYLHVGMMSEIRRKSLPAIAKVVGLHDAQPLQNFLTDAPWSVMELRKRRLELTLRMLKGRSFHLVIDETGDKKKGNKTDYVARQYIGNLGKVENGIVSVNAYGVCGEITFPLMFKIFKPQKRLQEKDCYQTKPQLAAAIIEELREKGFVFDLVLADSLYGSSPTFLEVLNKYQLDYILAIRANDSEFTTEKSQVVYGDWQEFERIFTDGESQPRYIQQITKEPEKSVTYWRITTDPNILAKNQTWYVKTNLKNTSAERLGNLYGFRNWIEYAFKQGKNELGWADYRLTSYPQLEKWWEVVMSVYFLVSCQADNRDRASPPGETHREQQPQPREPERFCQHQWWDRKGGWKSTLNNLRLIIQPYIFFHLITPWLKVFELPSLRASFLVLIKMLNEFHGYLPANSG